MTQMPRLIPENKPRVNIGHCRLDRFQICDKALPSVSGLQSQFVKDFFVVPETSHCHVRADTELFAAANIGTILSHGRDQAIPDFIPVRDVQILTLIYILLLICSHNSRCFAGGEFDLNYIASIILVFLFHRDTIALRIVLRDDLIEQIDCFDFSGKEHKVNVLFFIIARPCTFGFLRGLLFCHRRRCAPCQKREHHNSSKD